MECCVPNEFTRWNGKCFWLVTLARKAVESSKGTDLVPCMKYRVACVKPAIKVPLSLLYMRIKRAFLFDRALAKFP